MGQLGLLLIRGGFWIRVTWSNPVGTSMARVLGRVWWADFNSPSGMNIWPACEAGYVCPIRFGYVLDYRVPDSRIILWTKLGSRRIPPVSIHERKRRPVKPAKVFVVLREGVIVCFEVPKAEGSSQVLVHMIQGWLVLQIFLWAQERPREVGTGVIWTKPCM